MRRNHIGERGRDVFLEGFDSLFQANREQDVYKRQLQQDAANKINFRTRKTMMVAQQLYEGINLGSGAQGLITYMRTDSTLSLIHIYSFLCNHCITNSWT